MEVTLKIMTKILGKIPGILSVQKCGSPGHFAHVQRLAAKDNVCQILNIFYACFTNYFKHVYYELALCEFYTIVINVQEHLSHVNKLINWYL